MHVTDFEKKFRLPDIGKAILEMWRLLKNKREEFNTRTTRNRLASNASGLYYAWRIEAMNHANHRRALAVYYRELAPR